MKNNPVQLFLAVIISFCPGILTFGQDISFSQFRESPLLINPALTGYPEKKIRAGVNYRDQWKSFHAPFRTASAYVDASKSFHEGWKPESNFECLNKRSRTKKISIGYGGYLFSDKAGDGDLKTINAMVLASFGIWFSKYAYVSAGLAFGFGHKSIDFTKLKFMSQWNGSSFNTSLPDDLDNVQNSFTYGDLNAGLFFCDSLPKKITLSIGVSILHLTRPVNDFLAQHELIPLKINLQTWIDKKIRGFRMEFAGYYSFQNQLNASILNDDFDELIIGASINNLFILQVRNYPNPTKATDLGTMNVQCGLYLRLLPVRDIIPVIGLEKNNLKLTFSYDINMLEKYSSYPYKGGFEFSFSIGIPTGKASKYLTLSKN